MGHLIHGSRGGRRQSLSVKHLASISVSRSSHSVTGRPCLGRSAGGRAARETVLDSNLLHLHPPGLLLPDAMTRVPPVGEPGGGPDVVGGWGRFAGPDIAESSTSARVSRSMSHLASRIAHVGSVAGAAGVSRHGTARRGTRIRATMCEASPRITQHHALRSTLRRQAGFKARWQRL